MHRSLFRTVLSGSSQPRARATAILLAIPALAAGCAIIVMFVAGYEATMIMPYVGMFFAVMLLFFIDRRLDLTRPPAAAAQVVESPALTRRQALVRRAIELAMDMMLATAAFFGALLLRFEFAIPATIADRMFASLPFVVASTILAFTAAGIYRGDWKSISASEGVRFATASVLAGGLAYVASHFSAFVIPRTSCVIFVILVFNLLVATRWSSHLLLPLVRAPSASNRRAVMVGADVRGHAAIQHYLDAVGAGTRLVGVIDDDHFMHGKFFHGYPVLGSLDDIGRVFERTPFDEILIVQERMQPPQLNALQSFALQRGIALKRFAMSVSNLDPNPPHRPTVHAT